MDVDTKEDVDREGLNMIPKFSSFDIKNQAMAVNNWLNLDPVNYASQIHSSVLNIGEYLRYIYRFNRVKGDFEGKHYGSAVSYENDL